MRHYIVIYRDVATNEHKTLKLEARDSYHAYQLALAELERRFHDWPDPPRQALVAVERCDP